MNTKGDVVVLWICEMCGRRYQCLDAEKEFVRGVDARFEVDYYNFHRRLCGACAIEEYRKGHYFEDCECCGKAFSPEDEFYRFQRRVSQAVWRAGMYAQGILCADCAVAKLDEEVEPGHDGCSAHDAALAWLFHGKDEDYMFGYSEEELEDAL